MQVAKGKVVALELCNHKQHLFVFGNQFGFLASVQWTSSCIGSSSPFFPFSDNRGWIRDNFDAAVLFAKVGNKCQNYTSH
jgi:hypothetical protein